MTSVDAPPLFYWARYTSGNGRWRRTAGRSPEGPPGVELAALRRGLGREPGSVPAMWPFYVLTNDEGERTPEFDAEHAALTLFAVHQQSQALPMHRAGIGLGTAVLELRKRRGGGPPDTSAKTAAGSAPDWSKVDAVDRRFGAAATATDLDELVMHLRGLVTQLRGIGQPLDYDTLHAELRDWTSPRGAGRVRRRWGMQYFTRSRPPKDTDHNDQDGSGEADADATSEEPT
jgi:CRISPR system Cascade subunit CasB